MASLEQRRDIGTGAGAVAQTQIEHHHDALRELGGRQAGEPQNLVRNTGVEQDAADPEAHDLVVVNDHDGSAVGSHCRLLSRGSRYDEQSQYFAAEPRPGSTTSYTLRARPRPQDPRPEKEALMRRKP